MLRAMSTFTAMPVDPKELRPLLHRKLDDATDEEIGTMHRMLLEIEAQRLWKELGAEVAEDWQSGRLTTEKVAESVRRHRASSPKP